jgi:hypothetical protein
MGRWKLLAGNLAVTLLLLALCALAGELWLRAVPERNDADLQDDGSAKWAFNPYRADGVLGYVHRPDWDTVHATSDFSVRVHIDHLGLRGAEAAPTKEPRTYRILVLGDSFAFGYGVGDDETFAARLQRELPPPPGFERIEVLNAGVAGWSADQYWLYLETRGFALGPDLVLLAETENDPTDLAWNRLELDARRLPVRVEPTRRMIDARGRMRYMDAGPLALPDLTLPGQRWLADHSVLYHWLRYRLSRAWVAWAMRDEARRQREDAGPPPEGPIPSLDPGAIQRGLWSGAPFQLRYHRDLLSAIRDACEERGVALATLLVSFRASQHQPEVAIPLAEDCARDPRCLTSASLLAGHPESELYFARDGHWRPEAHALVAAGLVRWLEAQPPWRAERGASAGP